MPKPPFKTAIATPPPEPVYEVGFDPFYFDVTMRWMVVENGNLYARCPSEAHARGIVASTKAHRAMLAQQAMVRPVIVTFVPSAN